MLTDAYQSAKLDKLKELKKFMYELMASEGDEEMSDDKLAAVMEKVEELDGSPAEMEMEGEMPEVEDEEDEMLEKKRKWFKPEPKAPSEGTAMMLAVGGPAPSMPGKMGKKMGSKMGKGYV